MRKPNKILNMIYSATCSSYMIRTIGIKTKCPGDVFNQLENLALFKKIYNHAQYQQNVLSDFCA